MNMIRGFGRFGFGAHLFQDNLFAIFLFSIFSGIFANVNWYVIIICINPFLNDIKHD